MAVTYQKDIVLGEYTIGGAMIAEIVSNSDSDDEMPQLKMNGKRHTITSVRRDGISYKKGGNVCRHTIYPSPFV